MTSLDEEQAAAEVLDEAGLNRAATTGLNRIVAGSNSGRAEV